MYCHAKLEAAKLEIANMNFANCENAISNFANLKFMQIQKLSNIYHCSIVPGVLKILTPLETVASPRVGEG